MNKKLLILLFSSLLLYQCNTKVLTEDRPAVGDIAFDPNIDNKDFKICNGRVVQYYQIKTGYEGGTKAIKDYILDNYFYQQSFASENGYITVKFIVNCEGDTDRFRVLEIDKDYQPKTFPKAMTEQILTTIKKMDKWVAGQARGRTYDSYYYINLKIVNGKIVEVLP